MRWAGLVFALCWLFGCEYSGHSVKAQMGRRIGETVAGTEYNIGCEVQFRRAQCK